MHCHTSLLGSKTKECVNDSTVLANVLLHKTELRFYTQLDINGSLQRHSYWPTTQHDTGETKPNTTKADMQQENKCYVTQNKLFLKLKPVAL